MLNVLAFFRPGLGELLIILLVVLVIFGASRLPKIGEALGEAIKGFRKSVKEDEKNNVRRRAWRTHSHLIFGHSALGSRTVCEVRKGPGHMDQKNRGPLE